MRKTKFTALVAVLILSATTATKAADMTEKNKRPEQMPVQAKNQGQGMPIIEPECPSDWKEVGVESYVLIDCYGERIYPEYNGDGFEPMDMNNATSYREIVSTTSEYQRLIINQESDANTIVRTVDNSVDVGFNNSFQSYMTRNGVKTRVVFYITPKDGDRIDYQWMYSEADEGSYYKAQVRCIHSNVNTHHDYVRCEFFSHDDNVPNTFVDIDRTSLTEDLKAAVGTIDVMAKDYASLVDAVFRKHLAL